MVSGLGKLDELHNNRYPHIKPTTVKQFIKPRRFLDYDISQVSRTGMHPFSQQEQN